MQASMAKQTKSKTMLSPIVLTALCSLTLLALASVRRIPEGHVYAFRRMDGHVRIVGAGTHLVMPLVERVTHKISLAGAAVAVEGLTRDDVTFRGVVYFQVLDPERAEVVIEDVEQLLRDSTHRLFAVDDLPQALEMRRASLKQALNAELRDRGLLIARVDLSPLA
jgi:regulator of protease activity HflC (stomatin/prohibitin superfamily)